MRTFLWDGEVVLQFSGYTGPGREWVEYTEGLSEERSLCVRVKGKDVIEYEQRTESFRRTHQKPENKQTKG